MKGCSPALIIPSWRACASSVACLPRASCSRSSSVCSCFSAPTAALSWRAWAHLESTWMPALRYRYSSAPSTNSSATRPRRSQRTPAPAVTPPGAARSRARPGERSSCGAARDAVASGICGLFFAPAGQAPASRSAEGGAARELSVGAQLLLDAQQLVVLRHALGAGGRAGLDLPARSRHRQVRDRHVLGLARAMADDGAVAALSRGGDRLQRLGERPDLVHLDEDRVRDT